MFLERKFGRRSPSDPHHHPSLCPALSAQDWTGFPEVLRDVMNNIQLLIAARRGYSHVLADFGLSPHNGHYGLEARIERLQRELPATLGRYETRFRLEELDVEVDDAGVAHMKVSGTLVAAPGGLVFRFGIVSCKIVSVEYVPADT